MIMFHFNSKLIECSDFVTALGISPDFQLNRLYCSFAVSKLEVLFEDIVIELKLLYYLTSLMIR